MAQGGERVDPRGAPGRQECGHDCGRQQQGDARREDERITRLHAEQLAFDIASRKHGGSRAGNQSRKNHRHDLGEDQAQDGSAFGAKRDANTDLAGAALRRVTAPTLLIVGSHDPVVIELNERALVELTCEARLEIVPGATHLFEEPGTLQQVATLATEWFQRWL